MTTPIRPQDLSLPPDGAMRFDAAMVSDPGSALFDPASYELNAVSVEQGGRQAAWFVQGKFGRGVLRHYRRGGLIARLSRNSYIWTGASSTRSFAEFELLGFMHAEGLPVPRPLAAAYWRKGLAYRAAILVERIDGVKPLAVQWPSSDAAAVAAAIFAMHEIGVWHADLNAYNILLDVQGKAWLIDFDKGRRQRLHRKLRQDNLQRLRRSLLKVAGPQALPWWDELDRIYWRLAADQGHV
ncbi:3-deoxy-D-manno-octulosonic acid kinase [Pollutimonas harenae]|uniref:3-deoxy-D-manno-octulosonic acid kinase n=1 Tax=Pollutimonas harenae TaxID=657015 RepID=A0A853H993_9BURK|nr:3-deoxy-D-manno-octulosonic acid kinase [Pollutimonas harenae]NYT86614.1 3-deoxy-D-manno-octulosonic acid kinase [Pollutimonas harenae]TEA69648.1 3-deoxy-D-manno-octulosonic acid kinase [Pollutimonas harenae]